MLRRAKQAPQEAEPRLEVGGLVLDRAARKVTLDDQQISLARREFDLLAELLNSRIRIEPAQA